MIERFLVALLVIVMASWAAGAFIASHIVSQAKKENDEELERLVDEAVEEAVKHFEELERRIS